MRAKLPPTTREQLLSAIVARRRARILHDARSRTSLEAELDDLLLYNPPFWQLPLPQLLAEWDAFERGEDAPDYTLPKLNLTDLRALARLRGAGTATKSKRTCNCCGQSERVRAVGGVRVSNLASHLGCCCTCINDALRTPATRKRGAHAE